MWPTWPAPRISTTACWLPWATAGVWANARGFGFGFGPAGGGDRLALFAVGQDAAPPGPGFHLAFDAPSHAAVDTFYAAALAAGAPDRGASGPRPQYGATYYAAFVADPDGHHLEAVCQ